MRVIIEILVFIMVIGSSGAIVPLIEQGGSVDQSFHLQELDANIFGPVLWGWKVAVLFVIFYIILSGKWRIFFTQFEWVVLIATCFFSIYWSEFPKDARRSAIEIFFIYALIQIHFRMCGWRRAKELLKYVFIFILILSVIFAIFLPSYGVSVGEHEGNWQGVFTHKNQLGLFSSLTFIFYLFLYQFDSSILKRFGIVLSGVLIIGSVSTTAYFCMAISTAIFVLFRFPLVKMWFYSWRYVLMLIAVFLCVYAIYASINLTEFDIGDKDTSFSQRNLIWAFILIQIYNSPWLGHGLAQISASVMSDSSEFKENVGFVVGTAHNGFLEAIHALGIVGLLLVIVLLLKPLRSIKKIGSEFDFIFIFMIIFIIQNMFSSNLLGFNILLVMLMYVSLLAKQKD